MKNQLHQNSKPLDAHQTLGGSEILELDAKVLEDNIVGESRGSYPTPNLEKNFSTTLSMNGGGSRKAEVITALNMLLNVPCPGPSTN